MSNEIVPFMDETQTSPDSPPTTQPTHSSSKRPQRSSFSDYLAIYYSERWGKPCKIEIEFNLISENHHLKHFFHPDKGHKYINLFYPKPKNVRRILDTMKGPSVLYLRGCDQLFHNFHHPNFSFENFKTLTTLEISNIGNLTTLPEKISEMIHLQTLNLSHLPIQHFPADDFFSKLTNLKSLILKACPNLHSLPKFPPLALLASLDLSHLPNIEALSDEFFSDMQRLQRLILRGCSKLHCLPSMEPLERLEFLDLSYTTLNCKTHPLPRYLTHIFCRDTKGSLYNSLLNQAYSIEVLDLSGAQHVSRNFQFHHSTKFLKFVDLSRTSIESIEFPWFSRLSILLLRKCSRLVQLSGMRNLNKLKVLDMSGCESLSVFPEDVGYLSWLREVNLCGCRSLRELREGIFEEMSCLKKLDLSKTKLTHLPSSAAKLIHRGTHLILSPKLSSNIENKNLPNVEIVEDDVASPCPGSDDEEGNSNIFNPNEFHIVSTFTDKDSPFKRYTDNFTNVRDFILDIHSSYRGRMLDDVDYILDNIDFLESFDDKNNARRLLHYLMNAVDHMKPEDFSLDSKNLKDLISLVVKLKLLVPRPKQKDSDPNKTGKNGDVTIPPYKDTEEEQKFLKSYDSLTKAQKSCLFCFALLPIQNYYLTTVKERTLIQLWYGEGFIDDAQLEQNVLVSSTATIEEIGQHILMILQERSFIIRSSDSRYIFLRRNVHYWVKEKAKEECFFNCMTPHLTNDSERACLSTSEYNSPSSCQIWLNQTKASHQNREYCFKNVRTLFNCNEYIIDIRTEWFSKMRNLHVLHLGSWESENDHIEVVDLNFLEELKNMKQLRLLHFEGVTGISKLPDSVCKLSHLKMINLRGCIQMEKLPSDIGFLQSLSHLDATLCPLLSMFPKGIKLLSNLEVLKGFLITYEFNGGQDKKACTLADLLELQKLRKLNLVVNLAKFPTNEDLQVFKKMKNICNLKITWLPNHYVEQEIQDVIGRKASRPSRWQRLKCWEQQTSQNDEAEEPIMTSSCLQKLKKLVLCCFPSETAPDWLHPSQMHNLEKLYFLGGHLKTMPGAHHQNTWNVKSLQLKHTFKLDIDWESLVQIFPNMTFLIKLPHHYLSSFSVDGYGLWKAETKEDEG